MDRKKVALWGGLLVLVGVVALVVNDLIARIGFYMWTCENCEKRTPHALKTGTCWPCGFRKKK